MHILYIYINLILHEFFFQPRSICEREIDFRILQPGSHVARNAGRARARKSAQGRAQGYLHIFLREFSLSADMHPTLLFPDMSMKRQGVEEF